MLIVRFLLKLMVVLAATAGCAAQSSNAGRLAGADAAESSLIVLELPELAPATSGDGTLRVAATTSIIGDVVSQVGGDLLDLVVLMAAGQDPHSFELSPSDLASLRDAQVIFVNGWNLEEGLISDLANAAGDAVMAPVSAGITPLPFGEHSYQGAAENQQHRVSGGGPDPHTWLDPHLVEKWIENISLVLSSLDPDHATSYKNNADAYLKKLQGLIDYIDLQVAAIPDDRRRMVTGHESLAYFAAAYDFDIVGTVIPAVSTLAVPSTSELAGLIRAMEVEGVCTIYTETTTNDQLARTVAAELESCAEVKVVKLNTGALGPTGSGAEEYLTMMRSNINAIVEGLNG